MRPPEPAPDDLDSTPRPVLIGLLLLPGALFAAAHWAPLRAATEPAAEQCPAPPPAVSLERPVQAGLGAYAMGSPLPARFAITPDFGAPRGKTRRHEGVDIPAPRMTPVFAVADGAVSWAHDERGGNCCDLQVTHDDGWRTRYIHLNNDRPGTDDGQGFGIADGLDEGSRVEAGQLIGWVGDSGNAEACTPHLHFELRTPDGKAVDPLASLQAAMASLPEPPRVIASK